MKSDAPSLEIKLTNFRRRVFARWRAVLSIKYVWPLWGRGPGTMLVKVLGVRCGGPSSLLNYYYISPIEDDLLRRT